MVSVTDEYMGISQLMAMLIIEYLCVISCKSLEMWYLHNLFIKTYTTSHLVKSNIVTSIELL